jgi:peptide deformylase
METLRYYPDEILYQRAEPVADIDAGIADLAESMIETMHRSAGIGLAAPQVGLLKRMFVVHVEGDKPRVFINPQILRTSMEEVDIEEGCLSIPGIYAKVRRPRIVEVQAFNERGRPFTIEADGLLSRVIQHENDHLSGVLFIDHLSERARKRAMKQYSVPA